MRALALLVLIAAVADAEVPRFKRFTQRSSAGRTQRGLLTNSLAFFEAFPANGAGTSGVCSTTSPTGAKGEALTFTRASTAICTKTATGGLATTGIANGDLVSLTNDKPRVEYDSAGTLGLLVEATRTNFALRSQEIDNVVWSKVGTGVAAPVVTADFATAPDGTLTADRVQFTALTATAQASTVQQAIGSFGGATVTNSVYLRGNGTSGTLDFWSTSPTLCTTCSYVSGSWTRCSLSPAPSVTGTWALGNDTNISGTGCAGGTSRAAADVLVWGTQAEGAGSAYVTSYIPTVAATVTRATETNSYFAMSFSTAAGFSEAHSFVLESTTNFTGSAALWADATNRTQLYQSGTNSLTADYFSTAGNRTISNVPGAWVPGTTYRVALAYSGAGASSTIASYLAGVLQGTSATGVTGAWTGTQYGIGLNNPWGQSDSIVSRMCLDPSITRCR